jgi:hypothetical protein
VSNDKPKYDFEKELNLGPDDRLEGYNLWHEGEWYDLHDVEAAYEKADERGYVKGALLAQSDGTLLVVVGRNASVRHEETSAVNYPVAVQYFDDFLDYGLDFLVTLVQCPVRVFATTAPSETGRASQTTMGLLTAVEVDDRRGATVVIDHQRYLLRDLFQLKLA